MSRLLDDKTLRGLHAAAIQIGLDRRALLVGVPAGYVASLRQSDSPTAQLMRDLETLNATPSLMDGSVPLVSWLENAVAFSGLRREGAVFEAALARLSKAAPEERPSPDSGNDPRRPDPETPHGTSGTPPGPGASASPIRIYVSASRKDDRIVERLEKHLAPLLRARSATLWHRGMLGLGLERRAEAQRQLDSAHLLLAILSSDYLAEEDTYLEGEQAVRKNGLWVVPILARPAAFELSPFRELQPVPFNRVPVTSWSDQDSAFTEIAQAIATLLDQAQPAQSQAAGTTEQQPASSLAPTAEHVGQLYSKVFKRSGVPEVTYVAPQEAVEVASFLLDRSHALLLQGPTQIGKSTLVSRALGGAEVKEIDAKDDDAAEQIEGVIKGTPPAFVVVDDVHWLPDALFDRLTRFGRKLADKGQSKLVLLGIRRAGRTLSAEIAGRFDQIDIGPQPAERILALVEQGERAANLKFLHKKEIASASLGSFRLAQEICLRLALKDHPGKITESVRTIALTPDAVIEDVNKPLKEELEAPIHDFVRATEAPAERGVRIALLWLLSRVDSMAITSDAAQLRYPHLVQGVAWVERHLEDWLSQHSKVAEILFYRAGQLSARDPRVLYFLRATDWPALGAKSGGIGLEVGMSHEDELIIVLKSNSPAPPATFTPTTPASPSTPPPAQAGSEPVPESTQEILYPSIPDVLPHNLWQHPKTNTLRNLLLGAYDSERIALHVTREAGMRRDRIVTGSGIEPLWNSILEEAARQKKLGALLLRALSDPNIEAYHDGIRECLEPIVVQKPPHKVPAS
ncbi:MAG: hypothetical protein R3B70_40275 [Polyangiaceae bacterium]